MAATNVKDRYDALKTYDSKFSIKIFKLIIAEQANVASKIGVDHTPTRTANLITQYAE